MSIKICEKVNIKHTADDIFPNITGMAVKPNGEFVLVDNIHNTIILIDNTMTVKETMNLTRGVVEGTRKPYDVALVNDTEVIVTYPGPRLLQFVKISPHLETGKLIDLNKDIWGVEVSSKNIYVTCGGPKPEVVVLDPNGEIQRTNDIRNVDPNFEGASYIAANLEGTKLYLRYCEHLLCISVDGELLFSFSRQELNGASGVGIDNEDNAYVCSFKTGRILKIKSDGSSSMELLTSDDGLKRPKSICYSAIDGSIFVGGHMDELLVCKRN